MDVELLKLLVTAIAIPFGLYMLRSINETRKELNEHKIYCAENYFTTQELTELKKEIRSMISDLKADVNRAIDSKKK